MAGHAQLKFVITECSKTQIRLTGLIFAHIEAHFVCLRFYCPINTLTLVFQISHVVRKPVYAICEQQRRRSACTSAHSDQNLCCHCLDSIIPLLAISKISRLQLASVAEQAGLSLTWLESLNTGFLMRLEWFGGNAAKFQARGLKFPI